MRAAHARNGREYQTNFALCFGCQNNVEYSRVYFMLFTVCILWPPISLTSGRPSSLQNPVWDDFTYVYARAALPDFSSSSTAAAMPSSAQLIEVIHARFFEGSKVDA